MKIHHLHLNIYKLALILLLNDGKEKTFVIYRQAASRAPPPTKIHMFSKLSIPKLELTLNEEDSCILEKRI